MEKTPTVYALKKVDAPKKTLPEISSLGADQWLLYEMRHTRKVACLCHPDPMKATNKFLLSPPPKESALNLQTKEFRTEKKSCSHVVVAAAAEAAERDVAVVFDYVSVRSPLVFGRFH